MVFVVGGAALEIVYRHSTNKRYFLWEPSLGYDPRQIFGLCSVFGQLIDDEGIVP